jgi:diaminohydroxyphosphoribosylaminopyrimidine deaminase/5-amino-6-(5-phosphoribosylamino)uracil reductase
LRDRTPTTPPKPVLTGDGITTNEDGKRFQSWDGVPDLFRSGTNSLPQPWQEIFGPLRTLGKDGLFAIGQIGQSLDGRIATPSGHSHYVNGDDGLAHLHRLRALVDVVVVGIGTVLADDPQLTVRRVSGPQPARVVIDPNGKLPHNARVLADDGVRRIVLTGDAGRTDLPQGTETLSVKRAGESIPPQAMLDALGSLGFRRILIEGGANTVSRFLSAGCLDRLHVVVAPIVIGSGPAGLSLAPIERMDQALRFPVRTHNLGAEILFDCDLSAQRFSGGSAKKST